MTDNDITEFLNREIKPIIDKLKRDCYESGKEAGISKTLKFIFDQKRELKEQCNMCRNNQHNCCLIYKTFLLIELNYECNCSCQSTSNLRQRLKMALEELEKERARKR